MSHSSKIFEEAPVKVQNKNGFDLSHLNCGSSKCGQLVPVLCKLLPPNSDFTLGVNLNVELPPLATNFMGRVDFIVEGFVVPCSMLYGGFKQFISNQQATMFPANQDGILLNGGFAIPYVTLGGIEADSATKALYTSLMASNDNVLEYLGVKDQASLGVSSMKISLLPLLAYHLIWDVWYRNKQVTKTIFAVNPNTSSNLDDTPNGDVLLNIRNVSLIWHSFYISTLSSAYSANFTSVPTDVRSASPVSLTVSSQLTFPDGTSIFSTRQRNYARDYFTAGTPSPQQGNASKLIFDTSGANGEFTINALRAANALQKFLETNNLSSDFADMIRNRWGGNPIDADFDEPYYLGRVVLPVYQKSVYQSTSSEPVGSVSSNPFVDAGTLGAKGANGGFTGEGSITQKFHNSTWSYVMCLASLVPHAMYSQGVNRELQMISIGDFPAPEMQAVGNEAVYTHELYYVPTDVAVDRVFSYIPRYSRFKYMDDEVHGELRAGKSLDSFVLQRIFANVPNFDTAFLEIPQDALDDVFAIDSDSMNLSCWYEIFFEFKVSMPLADFCIPTLGDIQDTHTQHTKIGGSRL